MSRPFYSRRHYESLSNGAPDSPALAKERIARRLASEQANREMVERFAPLTIDNALDAVRWQDKRIAELVAAALARMAVRQ